MNLQMMIDTAIAENPGTLIAAAIAGALALISIFLTLFYNFAGRSYEKKRLLFDLMSEFLDLSREKEYGAARRIIMASTKGQLELVSKEKAAVLPASLKADIARLITVEPDSLSVTTDHVVLDAYQSTLVRDQLFRVVNAIEAISAAYRLKIVKRKHFLEEFENVLFRGDVSVFDNFVDIPSFYPSIKIVREEIRQRLAKKNRNTIIRKE